MKYHCQIKSAIVLDDGSMYPRRDINAETRQIIVDAQTSAEAQEKANKTIYQWQGDWILDGLPVRRGSHPGQMIG